SRHIGPCIGEAGAQRSPSIPSAGHHDKQGFVVHELAPDLIQLAIVRGSISKLLLIGFDFLVAINLKLNPAIMPKLVDVSNVVEGFTIRFDGNAAGIFVNDILEPQADRAARVFAYFTGRCSSPATIGSNPRSSWRTRIGGVRWIGGRGRIGRR